ncbi:MAG: hypothetical protein AcusKO_16140 [Acuticoccus sp.]
MLDQANHVVLVPPNAYPDHCWPLSFGNCCNSVDNCVRLADPSRDPQNIGDSDTGPRLAGSRETKGVAMANNQ